MGKKSPKAPDFSGLAQQEAQSNKEAIQYQTQANRPNQFTPWGSSQWNLDPATGKSTQNVALDRVSQATLDNQRHIAGSFSNTANDLRHRARRNLVPEMDYRKFTEWGDLGDYDTRRQAAEDGAYGRSTSRLDPYWEQQNNDMDVQLRSQGLVPGDAAYDRAYANMSRSQNDAYALAQADSQAAGRQESELAFGQQLGEAAYGDNQRNNQVAEELQRRGWTINEINALTRGREIGLPQSPDFAVSGNPGGTDYGGVGSSQYQANLDKYNAGQQQTNSLFSGLGGIAKTGIGIATGKK